MIKTGADPFLETKHTLKQGGRLLRHQARRAAVLLQHRRLSLSGVPVLFANSFPKSGTHLLSQILEGFTQLGPAVASGLPVILTHDFRNGKKRSQNTIMNDLRRLQPGDIGFGHLHSEPPIVRWLGREDWASYFIYRDPRDVVVSHVYYLTEMVPFHVHYDYFTSELGSIEERLKTSIRGLSNRSVNLPDIASRFAPFLGWLQQPAVLALQFEALVHEPEAQLERVLQHALERGFPLQVDQDTAIRRLLDSIDPGRSPTFRSGKTGGWREHFTPEITALFKETAGDLLIRLGYEENYDW